MEKSKSEYGKKQDEIKPIVILWFKRIYVVAFNIYAWFWLVREILIRHSTDWEQYALWFFTTTGMYYFVLENQDLFFKKKTIIKNTER